MPKHFSMTLDENTIDRLQIEAKRKTLILGKEITYQDVMRDIIATSISDVCKVYKVKNDYLLALKSTCYFGDREICTSKNPSGFEVSVFCSQNKIVNITASLGMVFGKNSDNYRVFDVTVNNSPHLFTLNVQNTFNKHTSQFFIDNREYFDFEKFQLPFTSFKCESFTVAHLPDHFWVTFNLVATNLKEIEQANYLLSKQHQILTLPIEQSRDLLRSLFAGSLWDRGEMKNYTGDCFVARVEEIVVGPALFGGAVLEKGCLKGIKGSGEIILVLNHPSPYKPVAYTRKIDTDTLRQICD